MTSPANKRQKREEYRRAQEEAAAAATAVRPESGGGGGGGSAKGGDGGSGNGKGMGMGRSGGRKMALPKKKFYRQRAHANPFSDHAIVYPSDPAEMDWSVHFPAFFPPSFKSDPDHAKPQRTPEIADIGCGFGGLLIALAPKFPDKLIIGLELRAQVLSYIHSRILALRSQHLPPPPPSPPSPLPPSVPTPQPTLYTYSNTSALRTNSMKTLPQLFPPHSLSAIFLAFPDPHFKARKHKARIVSRTLCAEYAFVLKRGREGEGGKVYTVTDVEELAGWIVEAFEGCDGGERSERGGDNGEKGDDKNRIWERVTEEELERDECVGLMMTETEEGKKVERNKGKKFVSVWRRREDPVWPDEGGRVGMNEGGDEGKGR